MMQRIVWRFENSFDPKIFSLRMFTKIKDPLVAMKTNTTRREGLMDQTFFRFFTLVAQTEVGLWVKALTNGLF